MRLPVFRNHLLTDILLNGMARQVAAQCITTCRDKLPKGGFQAGRKRIQREVTRLPAGEDQDYADGKRVDDQSAQVTELCVSVHG